MSDSSAKPPSSSAGTNPPLGTNSPLGSKSVVVEPAETHRLPGGFVPPSDHLARGVPKSRSVSKAQQGKGNPGRTAVIVMGAVVLLGAATAVFLLSANKSQEVLEPEQGPALANPAAMQVAAVPLPDWVPTYPSGAQTSLISNMIGGEPQGTLQFKTTNSPRAVASYYQQKLTELGLVVTGLSITDGSGVVETKSQDGMRKVIVMIEPSPEGARASVVFTTMDPDKSRPIFAGALPDFAPVFPGAEVVQQITRVKDGQITGFVKTKVRAEIGAILDFYQPKFEAARYEVKRTVKAGFGKLAGQSLKAEGSVDLFAEEENNAVTIVVKVDPDE